MATGSGKTEVFIELIKRANVKTIVAVSSVNLAVQTANRIRKYNLDAGIYSASAGFKDTENKFIVGTVQSLIHYDFMPKLIIVDEGHNISNDEDSYYQRLLNENFDAKVAGFTATPFRSDGGLLYGSEKIFPRLNFERGLNFMIQNGHLVPPVLVQGKNAFDLSNVRVSMGEWAQQDINTVTLNNDTAQAQVADALLRLDGRKKVAWATSSINHAEIIHKLLPDSAIVHSQIDSAPEIKRFENDPACRHVVFVTMLKEGYDYAPIDAIVLMRPTRSPVLYVQICGRGLRLSPGKKDCLILDYGRVVESLGPLSDPKIPEDRRYKAAEQSPIKACPKCGTYVPKESSECEFCNYKFSRPVEVRLTAKPATNLIILGEQKNDVFKLSRIEVHDHKSKNGNSCFKVVMYETGILSFRPRHTQWFVKSRPRDFYNLILQLNIDALSESNYAVDFTHEVEIERKKEGDFYKVVRVTNRASHLRLPKIKL